MANAKTITRHTPGPWTTDALGTVRGGKFEFLLTTRRAGAPPDEWRANANLIAAAPELLEDARKNDSAFTFLAEQMNSITDNAKYWTIEEIEALAQDLRVCIERWQKRNRAAIATAAEGRIA